jgi:hypothetical protein
LQFKSQLYMEKAATSLKHAVIIIIEDYRNKPQIPSVKFARNDGEAFKQMLIEHLGFTEDEITYWVDNNAVQNTLTNDLPYLIQGLSPDHEFIFYFAGHGFFQDGHNKLTCWDSHQFNLSGTTVSLKDVLFDPLQKSGCQKSLVFLDCCSSVLTDELNNRDVISDMNEREFDAFVRTGKYDAVYSSCSAGEKSSSSGIINHGIWTYFLIKALSGGANDSIVKERYITSNSLQNYLSVAVPKFIREQKEKFAKQTPFVRLGAANEFLIRELPEKEVDMSLPALQLNLGNVTLRKISEMQVKKATGFIKSYSVPKFINRTTQIFVQKVFFEESKDEIREISMKAKRTFGMRDNEMKYDCQVEGGYVLCPYFNFSLTVNQHEKDATLATITREIVPLIPLRELPKDFDSIFPIGIDEMIIPIEGKVDFDDLALKFENLAERHNGTVKPDKIDGIIEYITENNTSLTVNVDEAELIVTRYYISGAMTLIQESIEDIQQLSQQKLQLITE